MTNPSFRPARSRAAAAIAALAVAATVAVGAPAPANAAMAIPAVPDWVTKVLPAPEQVKDGSTDYSELIMWLGGEDVRGVLGEWNKVAGGAGGLLPVFGSESKYTNGRDSSGLSAKPGSMHFKQLLERADMKGFYDLVGKDSVDMLGFAELLMKSKGMILDRHENVTTVDWLFVSGTTRLADSYAWMPAFKLGKTEVPEFAIWIPEAKGDYTSLGGSGFGFNNSLPTMALPGLGAIPLPHLAGYVTAPFGLGGADYYLKTQLPSFGADGSIGLGLPALGGSLTTPLGKFGLGFDKAASVSILDGGLGLGFGAPVLTWTDPLGTGHKVGFELGGISYTQAGGLKVNGPDLTYTTTPAPKVAATTLDVAVPEPAAADEERVAAADVPVVVDVHDEAEESVVAEPVDAGVAGTVVAPTDAAPTAAAPVEDSADESVTVGTVTEPEAGEVVEPAAA